MVPCREIANLPSGRFELSILSDPRSLDQMATRDQNPTLWNDWPEKRKESRSMLKTRRSVDALLIAIAIASRIARCLDPSKPPCPAQHVRTRRDRGQSARRAWFCDQIPGRRWTDLSASASLSDDCRCGLRDRRGRNPSIIVFAGTGPSHPGWTIGLRRVAAVRFSCAGQPWMAWTAGLIVALHPTLVYAATHVQVATLGATLLTWTLAWAYRTGSQR